MFAVLRAGGVVSCASPAYNADEMAYALEKAGAKYLMTIPSSMKVAAVAAEKAGLSKENVLLLDGELEGFTNIQHMLSTGKDYGQSGQIPPSSIPSGQTNRDALAFLSFSSGTTGLPKAVMIAHSNVVGQCFQLKAVSLPSYTKTIAVLPFFHITGLVHLLHLPVFFNMEAYIMSSFKLETMLDVASKYKIADWVIVPPIVILLTRAPESLFRKYDFSFVQRIMSGAAPLSAEVAQALQRRFPKSGFSQGYGLTESTSCISMTIPEFYDYKYAHYAGNICPSTYVKIVDPATGKECGENETGEIWAKGPQITLGYLDNEKATRETFDTEGYLHTGDIGKVDKDDLLLITDRLKEMIKVKGVQIAPAEIEDFLLGHDLVADCALLGIKDDYAGEKPKAYVVLKKGAFRLERDLEAACKTLIQYVKDRKDKHKWIVEVEVVDQIPKSASGKILRRVLRDQAAGGKTGYVYRDKTERARL